MAHPRPDRKVIQLTQYPALGELMKVPRGYQLKDRTSFTAPDLHGGGVLMHVCRACGKTAAEHIGPQQLCPAEFSLVNEKPEESKLVILDHDYTRDELILLIGNAYAEIVQIIKQFGEAHQAAHFAYDVAETLFKAAMTIKGHNDWEPAKWKDVGGTAITRMKQATDVLRTIAYDTNRNPEQLRFIARQYIEGFVQGKALVNENEPSRDSQRPTGNEGNVGV